MYVLHIELVVSTSGLALTLIGLTWICQIERCNLFSIACRLRVEVMAPAIVVNVIVKLVTEELIVRTAL